MLGSLPSLLWLQDIGGGHEQAAIWLSDPHFILKEHQPRHSPSQVCKQSENHIPIILLSISVARGLYDLGKNGV